MTTQYIFLITINLLKKNNMYMYILIYFIWRHQAWLVCHNYLCNDRFKENIWEFSKLLKSVPNKVHHGSTRLINWKNGINCSWFIVSCDVVKGFYITLDKNLLNIIPTQKSWNNALTFMQHSFWHKYWLEYVSFLSQFSL